MQVARVPSLIRELDPTFQVAPSGKEPTCQFSRCPRCGFHPSVEKIPGGRHGDPLQYFCLENPMGRGTLLAAVHGAVKSQTRLKWPSVHGGENKSSMSNSCRRQYVSLFFHILAMVCVCGVSHHGDITDICKRNERTKVILLIGNSNSSCKEF